jgi:hypothetical protein
MRAPGATAGVFFRHLQQLAAPATLSLNRHAHSSRQLRLNSLSGFCRENEMQASEEEL